MPTGNEDTGLRRRGHSTKKATQSGDGNRASTRQSVTFGANDDDDDSELDKPLIANEEGRKSTHNAHYNKSRGDSEKGGAHAVNDSDEDRRDDVRQHHGLTNADNGAWNRLSCVSLMLSRAAGTKERGAVYNTAVDVAVAVIDKLPSFFSEKLTPVALTDNGKRGFVDKFRTAFAATYNRQDKVHVSIVKDLYRQYYALCCADADPTLDMRSFLETMERDGEEEAAASAASDARKDSKRHAMTGGITIFDDDDDDNQKKQKLKSSSASNPSDCDDTISSEFWKLIGFQGTDPGTDFRGGGTVSLLLLLHLFKNRPDLIRSIFRTREQAPDAPSPPSSSSATASSSSSSPKPPDFHHAPPFFVKEMNYFTTVSGDSATATAGGHQFLSAEYPFAIAAINVAMHLMMLLGIQTTTTCLATTENINSYAAKLARAKVIAITYDDNGNCKTHDEPPHSCRSYLVRMIDEAATRSPNVKLVKPEGLVEGFDHFAAVFETAIAIMHNEWHILPPKEKNILFFNQVLAKAREKTEVLLRRCENILELNKAAGEMEWIRY